MDFRDRIGQEYSKLDLAFRRKFLNLTTNPSRTNWELADRNRLGNLLKNIHNSNVPLQGE